MRKVLAVLYTALLFGANGAWADIASLREGDMKKLSFSEAKVLPDVALHDAKGAAHALADWQGQWVVLNFWATWCAPCRHEMPSLAALQAALPEVAVLPVATGRNSPEGVQAFFADVGVTNLPVLLDPKSELARNMGVLGLPVTVIVNPQGMEVARLTGDADWNSAHAHVILTALMAGE
jgi:thiol-disulfide isomerase/thioredoxin